MAEDRRVQHLVVDAGPLIQTTQLQNLAVHFYAPQDVMDELRDAKTRRNLELIPFDIVIREPTLESMNLVAEEAKKTGDYPSLSVADLKVLALTVDLHKQFKIPIGEVNSEAEPHSSQQVEVPEMPAGGHLPDGFCKDEVDSSDDEGWITAENVKSSSGMQIELEETPEVACITTDFALQNVLLAMKLHLISLAGKRIARIQSYILRCRACLSTCSNMTKQFCPKCGNKSLHKCAVSVDANGEQVLHINYRRLAVTRGLRYSRAAPTGGKHSMQEKLFEDQRQPHLRPARVRSEKAWDEPFAVHDVTSRSAALGVRCMANQARREGSGGGRGGGKKRGSKR